MLKRSLPAANEEIVQRRKEILRTIKKIAPQAHWIDDEFGMSVFETDALATCQQMPLAVVLPSSTDEISKILKFCYDNQIKIIARGGGTSLSGAALPTEDAIVIAMTRMNKVIDLDYTNRTARVQAGITNNSINESTKEEGFFFAPDPASRLSCTIGGNIAMDASGSNHMKYGSTTNNVLGLKLVLIDGQTVDFGGKWIDTASYDFLGMITGSEGQLGIITETTLRLHKCPPANRVLMIAFDSVRNAGDCIVDILAKGVLLSAFEFLDKSAIRACKLSRHSSEIESSEAVLALMAEGSEIEIDEHFELLRKVALPFAPKSFKEAQSSQESNAIWQDIETIYGTAGKGSDYYCVDGMIPISSLTETVTQTYQIAQKMNLNVLNVFHAGDGRLLTLISYGVNNSDEQNAAINCGKEILEFCIEKGGSISGELGIGIDKRDLMPLQFMQSDLDQQMIVKNIFDPDWLLNPAKVFPLESSPVSENTQSEYDEQTGDA